MAKIKVNNKKEPVAYPADHQLGMIVPLNGSDCEKCEYWKDGECANEIFKKWNGSGKIPISPDRYCCDLFETSK
jgi:hypothetical protein